MSQLTSKNNKFQPYNGEENCKIKFPMTYKALQRPLLKCANSMNGGDPPKNMFLGLKYQDYKSAKSSPKVEILLDSMVESRHTSGYLEANATAVRKSTGEVIATQRHVVFFTPDGRKNGTTFLLEIEEKYQSDCKITLESAIVEESGVINQTDTYDICDYDKIESVYTVAHPRREVGHPVSDPYINYFYFRSPEHGEYVDYKYTNGNKLMCKFEGTAVAKNHAVKKIISANLMLDSDGNQIIYNNFLEKVRSFGLGVQWGNIEDWQRNISEFMKYNVGLVTYILNVTCTLEDTGEKRHSFTITNQDQDPKYPILRFNWGCLAKGTFIATPNGEVPIEILRTGDRVITENGRVASIRNAYRGMEEEPLVVICLENGREVIATISHPFLTDHGMEIANKLMRGHQLKTLDGNFVQVAETYADFFGPIEVYNLELEGDGIFFANGIASGDFVLQNSCSVEEERSNIPKEWLTDYDSFMELL